MNNVLTSPVQSVEARAARTTRKQNAYGNLVLGAVGLASVLAADGISKRITNAINNTHELVGAGSGTSFAPQSAARPQAKSAVVTLPTLGLGSK